MSETNNNNSDNNDNDNGGEYSSVVLKAPVKDEKEYSSPNINIDSEANDAKNDLTDAINARKRGESISNIRSKSIQLGRGNKIPSKYKFLEGKAMNRQTNYTAIRSSSVVADIDLLHVSTSHIVCLWEMSFGGAFAALPLDMPNGDRRIVNPVLYEHKAKLFDAKISPFKNNLVATAAEDGSIYFWNINDELTENTNDTFSSIHAHKKRVDGVEFHPTVDNLISSYSSDKTIGVWDVNTGSNITTLTGFGDVVQSSSWDYYGSLMCATSKDNIVRVFDVRAGTEAVMQAPGHSGKKSSRSQFLGEHGRLLTTGFSKKAEREWMLYDLKTFDKPLLVNTMPGAGSMTINYDNDHGLVFLSGKGDGDIIVMEVKGRDPYMSMIYQYRAKEPQRSTALLPKISVDAKNNELDRMYRISAEGVIDAVSFSMPRKKVDGFQWDIYPDTDDYNQSVWTLDEWKNKESLDRARHKKSWADIIPDLEAPEKKTERRLSMFNYSRVSIKEEDTEPEKPLSKKEMKKEKKRKEKEAKEEQEQNLETDNISIVVSIDNYHKSKEDDSPNIKAAYASDAVIECKKDIALMKKKTKDLEKILKQLQKEEKIAKKEAKKASK